MPARLERALERIAHARDEVLALAALLRDELRERAVVVRLEMLEREVLELPPHLRHTEAVRERRVQVPRLLRDPTALLGRQPVERPHVVQPVGQLDQDDANILRDRQQQLAVVLDLPFLRRVERQISDLRQAIDDLRDLLPELLLDVGDGDGRVLDDIVNQPARDRHRIELQVGENPRDLDAVRDERLAGRGASARRVRARCTCTRGAAAPGRAPRAAAWLGSSSPES